MEQRGMENPFLLQFHHPQNHQQMDYPRTFDDQQLSLAFSGLNLSCPPPFELPAGYLMENYGCPSVENGMNMNNNVHLMRAQNGAFCFNGSFVGPTSGARRDFLVGPVPGVNILGSGNGGGGGGGVHQRLDFYDGGRVDFGGSTHGVPKSLNFYDVGKRGNVYCQSGQTYGTNVYDPFLQSKNMMEGSENARYPPKLNFDIVGQGGNVYCQGGQTYGTNIYDPLLQSKNLASANENVSYPRMSQNVCLHEGLMDNLVPRNFNYIDKSLYERMHPCDAFCIKDFKGMIVLFAQDQSLSKVLQEKIEGQTFEDNEFVVEEVIDCICDLMKNQFGGYFIQRLFGVCNEDQRTRIIVAATRISSELVNVCLCSHGAKTVQTLMENLNTPQQISLVISALCPGVVVLCSDHHGQHVIRYCLTNFSYEFNKVAV